MSDKKRLPLCQGRQSLTSVKMNDPMGTLNGGGFQLRHWTVYPSLNRLSRISGQDRSEIQVEPKHMDVLVHLAANAGEVVSKRDLLATTWDQQYVADAVLTRAVAELRRALGDSAQDPQFIETIPRRGYRLIADVEVAPSITEVPEPGWVPLLIAAGFGFALGWLLSRP